MDVFMLGVEIQVEKLQ